MHNLNQPQQDERDRSIVATTQLETVTRFQSYNLWWTSNSPLDTKKEMFLTIPHPKMSTFPAARRRWFISQWASVVAIEQIYRSQEIVKTITTKFIKVSTICHPMEIWLACKTQFWRLKGSHPNSFKIKAKTK